jgi:hypothetical protein
MIEFLIYTACFTLSGGIGVLIGIAAHDFYRSKT